MKQKAKENLQKQQKKSELKSILYCYQKIQKKKRSKK